MTTTTTVKSDIEIAQEASMKKIQEIAADLNILEDELEPYGHYKGKLSLIFLSAYKMRKTVKLF